MSFKLVAKSKQKKILEKTFDCYASTFFLAIRQHILSSVLNLKPTQKKYFFRNFY